MGAVIGALHATGRRGRGRHGGGETADATLDRDASQRQTVDAVAELFEPERDSLRLEPSQLAAMFLGMLFARTRPPAGPTPNLDEFLAVFLHGAVVEEAD
jgi:hypothetical protein